MCFNVFVKSIERSINPTIANKSEGKELALINMATIQKQQALTVLTDLLNSSHR